MKKKVIIIGSGLGGLSTGVILAKNGFDVTVLEQSHQPGGCLQCFTRRGEKFETGMHFIGSADKGQTLDRLLHYLEIDKDIRISRLDSDGYDVICINGRYYRLPIGRDAFIKQMTEYFPAQKDNIIAYCDLIDRLSAASSLHNMSQEQSETNSDLFEYQLRSVNDVIENLVSDEELAKVLVGFLPLYAGIRDKTPFSVHAFITDFYNKSAYRVVGGSDLVAQSMIHTIEKYGGRVITSAKVEQIVCDEKQAVGLILKSNSTLQPSQCSFSADYYISDAHPARTLEMLDTKLIRPAFRKRVSELPQTVGGFTVYLHFKKDTMPYLNHNLYVYNHGTPWNCEQYDDASWPKGFLYMHFCKEEHQKFASTGCILSYMNISDLEQWYGTKTGRRGKEYEEFKIKKAEKLIDALEAEVPGIRDTIDHYYTSTPLTYLDYTGTEGGSMYGIARDISLGNACRIPQRTKVHNVLQTGQNINSHGMLGVLVGTIVTCSELIPDLISKISSSNSSDNEHE